MRGKEAPREEGEKVMRRESKKKTARKVQKRKEGKGNDLVFVSACDDERVLGGAQGVIGSAP